MTDLRQRKKVVAAIGANHTTSRAFHCIWTAEENVASLRILHTVAIPMHRQTKAASSASSDRGNNELRESRPGSKLAYSLEILLGY